MNKKLSRLFSTNLTVYFTVMVLICLVSWCRRTYIVAACETIATIGLFIYYKIRSVRGRPLRSTFRMPASPWIPYPTKR